MKSLSADPVEFGAPSISVVIPYHNEQDLLPRAVASVLSQRDAGNLEVIVVDDASEHPASAVLHCDSRLRVVRSEVNLHAAGARNLGLKESRSEFVAFLDADDEFLPGRLEAHLRLLANNPDMVLVGSPFMIVDVEGAQHFKVPQLIADAYPQLPRLACVLDKSFRQQVTQRYTFNTGAMTFRRSTLADAGGFESAYRWGEEWDLQVRIAQLGRVGFVPEPSYRYILRSGSITSTQDAAKNVSAAIMFRRWRKSIRGLSYTQCRHLRRCEHEQRLLAAQLRLEHDQNPVSGLLQVLLSLKCGVSWWAVRSFVRMNCHIPGWIRSRASSRNDSNKNN